MDALIEFFHSSFLRFKKIRDNSVTNNHAIDFRVSNSEREDYLTAYHIFHNVSQVKRYIPMPIN